MNKGINALKVLVLISIGLLVSFFSFSAFEFNTKENTKPSIPVTENTDAKVMPEIVFGINTDGYEYKDYVVQKNEYLSTILERYGVDPVRIAELVKVSKPVFNVRNIRTEKPYTVFTSVDNPQSVAYFVYQPNDVDYIVYDLRDSIQVYKAQRDIESKMNVVGGTIENSLYEALKVNGANPNLAVQLAQIFGGVIDFYSIKEGDWFKVQYETNYVADKEVSSGRIQSAQFYHNGKEYQAHYFQTDENTEGQYYDEQGNSMQRTFLKAPLKYSRISSRFTKRRLHPVQKVWKAHLGTDYAAPHGTPIIATGNGVVTESGFTRGNGNYVKIKHNNTYSTQYLHMSRRAAKKGQRIKQGQIIGYVGSTGLATGPHVCYRFWKNGVQVDPLRQNFKIVLPLSDKYKAAFNSELSKAKMELAAVDTTNGIKEKSRVAYLEEKPDVLFKYFSKEEFSDNI